MANDSILTLFDTATHQSSPYAYGDITTCGLIT